MRLQSAGLIDYWQKRDYSAPDRCLNWIPPKTLSRLSLRGLSGAFVVLGAGYSLAVAAFILERFIQLFNSVRNIILMVAV